MNSQDKSHDVLIVVDMQKCYLKFYKNQDYAKQMIGAVNATILEARRKNLKVIYIEHEYSNFFMRLFSNCFLSGAGIQGKSGFVTDERILKNETDAVFVKSMGDLFSVKKGVSSFDCQQFQP